MKRNGDIIIVEDDPDDWELLLDVFEQVMDELHYDNRVIVFEDSTMVLEYLRESEAPHFMILSDINMPMLNGFELRKIIYNDPELNSRCIPYIFLTTGAGPNRYKDISNDMPVQGIFEKPSSFTDYKNLIANIMDTWYSTPAVQ